MNAILLSRFATKKNEGEHVHNRVFRGYIYLPFLHLFRFSIRLLRSMHSFTGFSERQPHALGYNHIFFRAKRRDAFFSKTLWLWTTSLFLFLSLSRSFSLSLVQIVSNISHRIHGMASERHIYQPIDSYPCMPQFKMQQHSFELFLSLVGVDKEWNTMPFRWT